MLYCPKCQQTYEEGTQRFCLNDGGRLLFAPSFGKAVEPTEDVFSSVIARKNTIEADEFATAPRFSQLTPHPSSDKISIPEPELENAPSVEISEPEPEETSESVPEFDSAPPIYQKPASDSSDEIELEIAPLNFAEITSNTESILELEPSLGKISDSKTENDLPNANQSKPPRLINPNTIAVGQAVLGDRKTNPAGRAAVSWKNPEVLLGQTIKGHYNIIEQIGADESAIDYLAEDKTTAGKNVVVRVLMDDDHAKDSFADKIFAEERVALSHISHPSVVRVIDSGELLEGKPFVVTEYVKGESVKDRLRQKGRFDALQTARIIRQASYALSEVHQSGILHRNLKPENIILTANETGAEQVKLTNFGAAKGKLNEENLPYKSPEQIEGKLVNFAGDEFALAVIAYQMLTDCLPFAATKTGDLLKQQREGLAIETDALSENLPFSVYEILSKALAFNPAGRYPKARDFGDALFNAVTAKSSAAKAAELPQETAPVILKDQPETVLPLIVEKPPAAPKIQPKPSKTVKEVKTAAGSVKAAESLTKKKRASETPAQNNASRSIFVVLGLIVLAAGIFWIWSYFAKQRRETVSVAPAPIQNVAPVNQATNNPTTSLPPANTVAPAAVESFPPPRQIVAPLNTIYFQNNKEKLSDAAAKNFLGFSLYYPQNWTLKEAKNNFLDVSETDEKGLPIEQMLVSYYESKGTFSADREIFPKLLKKSNDDLSKALQGNYKIISQGETTIQNNRWQAFEVKFESLGTTADGGKVTLWGRRLWIPAQRANLKNGYVITMLATSLSKDIKSVEDVGVKGDLSNILETFEPNQNP